MEHKRAQNTNLFISSFSSPSMLYLLLILFFYYISFFARNSLVVCWEKRREALRRSFFIFIFCGYWFWKQKRALSDGIRELNSTQDFVLMFYSACCCLIVFSYFVDKKPWSMIIFTRMRWIYISSLYYFYCEGKRWKSELFISDI